MGTVGYVVLSLVVAAFGVLMFFLWRTDEARAKREAVALLGKPVVSRLEIDRALGRLRPVSDDQGRELEGRLKEMRRTLESDASMLVCPRCKRENAVRALAESKATYPCAWCGDPLPPIEFIDST